MPQRDYWLLPEGVQEVLPNEARRIESLRRKILDLFASWGYDFVIPPFIDFLESLLTGTGHDLDLQTFKLTDQLSGRMLGIRADMTPQVARIDAHHIKSNLPTRLCYLGTVLHTRGDHLEKSRTPMQVGAELYGHEGLASDLEVLSLMLEMLAVAGIQDIHLDLGHVGIYRGLAKQAGLDIVQESALFEVLQRKSRPELAELLSEFEIGEKMHSMFLSLVDLNGYEGITAKARQLLVSADQSVRSAISELDEIAKHLASRFPSLPINFDLAELSGYHYQTGIVFATFIPDYGREITRGGRYDEIGKTFGRARPATGFSADLKILATLSSIPDVVGEKKESVYAPPISDPVLDEKIRDLRLSGRNVIQALPGQVGEAKEMGCDLRLEEKDREWIIVAV